jgi:tetratricopeptide (TPR) repeat protein
VAALQEILLDRGLPLEAGVSLLMSEWPDGDAQREQIEAAIKAVDGIPFALERMASLLRSNRLLELRDQVVHEKTLDAFVALTHSAISFDAHLTLQARAVFNEDVPIDALKHVLAGVLNPPAVESAVEELGRGHLLFRISPALLGVHDLDREASYRSIESDGLVDRKQLHARAADYYARLCEDREYWFQWTSYDELRSDLKRFHHLVKAEQPLAAADAFSFSKVDFLSTSGHVRETADMFGGLDLGGEETRALLVKRYVLAHYLAIVGPFEDAIPKLRDVIELARTLGETHAELSATYELGTAYRYTGQYEDAVRLLQSLTARLRKSHADELLAYYLYGHSLACSYAGLYAEAIQLGQEQVRHGGRSGRSEFKARGNSCLCLPYYVIGMASEAATCAAASAGQFANTPKEHLLGFIENVHGLALHALGRWTEAVDAFSRGRKASTDSRRRRAGGLIAVNWGWALYDRGDLVGALSQIHDAIRAFDGISEADARLSHNLREAFEYAQDGDRRYEAEALWNFVASDYVNPDLVRRVAVAERILSLEGRVPSHTRQLAQAYVDAASSTLTGLRAELET